MDINKDYKQQLFLLTEAVWLAIYKKDIKMANLCLAADTKYIGLRFSNLLKTTEELEEEE